MTLRGMAEDISSHLVFTDRRWRVGGELVYPTADDVEIFLKKMIERCPDDSQIESGGVIVRKSAGHLDVFAHMGEIDA